MFGSMSVYSTHKNWRTEAESVRDNLSQAKNENVKLQDRYRNLESRLTAEVEAAQQEVRKLESERVALQEQNVAFQKDLDQLRQDQRKATAMVASTEENNVGLMKEVANSRDELRVAQQTRDEAFSVTLATTSALHEEQSLLTAATERMKQLLQQVGKQASLLDRSGIDPSTDPEALTPHVRGVISDTRSKAGAQLIEISIGADDGLKREHTVEIFRADRYLGRAVIVKTEPDRSVAQILRRYQKGQIQEGDDVATKLRIN
jgi:predicted  nucleic acid-binding Zn-ribbon protein